MKAYRNILVFVLATILLSGCAPRKRPPAAKPTNTPQATAFALPDTRIVADEVLADTPFYKLMQSYNKTSALYYYTAHRVNEAAHNFSAAIIANEIKAPVAII